MPRALLRAAHLFVTGVVTVSLGACGGLPPALPAEPARILLLGEQHDAPAHPGLQQARVEALAREGRLAALVLEMAEQGRSTRGLGRDAGEAAVREALAWNDDAWPWARYGAVVMAAVRAGVPVAGANLPMSALRARGADVSLDARLSPAALATQQAAVRDGHCGLLPEARLPAMTRMQIARDIALAETLAAQAAPGRVVLLVAGGGHVRTDIGVPVHLPPSLAVQAEQLPPHDSGRDHCAELRQQWQAPRR
ncbi:ChaN family lipoprotein [Ramlibacter sp.]|uniref:ChaN family lipoprotein n=1 Tax=Ramlibacter sp. TaxID=1917967 RepID=UPI0035B12AF1